MEEKKKTALAAIDAVFSDCSVSKRRTLEAMEELRSHIAINIDVLNDDLKNEEGED